MRRILFVDDEPSIRGIYNMLPEFLGDGYLITTAASAEEALNEIKAVAYDVVITDLLMPGMSGAELLSRVAQMSPATARVVVSGFADELTVAKCLLAGHRYFTKPFNPVSLTSSISALTEAREAVSCGRIRQIVGKMESLPTPSETYLRMIKALNNPDSHMSQIAAILEGDPSLSAKVLQAVNSAMFGSGRRIVSLEEALQLLGLQVLKALILTIQVFDFYQNPRLTKDLQKIWAHSTNVARRARQFAIESGWGGEMRDEVFFAALLHDIGRVVMAATPERERNELFPRYVLEHDDFSAEFALSHAIDAEAGAYLLSLWGLPQEIADGVRSFRSASYTEGEESVAAALAIAHELEQLSSERAGRRT